MNRKNKRKTDIKFSQTDDKIESLIQFGFAFKTKCESDRKSWESKREKYEIIPETFINYY